MPIINVGGMEPVFAVREQDEELQLEEADEQVQDETIHIEDERPPNLVNLLKDQELYEENPALEALREQPPLPSAAEAAGAQARPSLQPTPLPIPLSIPVPQFIPQTVAAAPAAQAAPLSPQGEGVLAQSLRESVEAQRRVVDRLFDEIRELSRKVDSRQPPSVIPVTLDLRQLAALPVAEAPGSRPRRRKR